MSTLKLDTIASRDGTESTDVTNVINGSAKAWVNFDGINNTIRASFNVSSITDNGTGNHSVNFTNAMSDANYAVSITGSYIGSPDTSIDTSQIGSALTTSSVTVHFRNYSSAALQDNYFSNVVVFR